MKKDILVVEDDLEIAELIKIYLENEGYIVNVFHKGSDGLNFLENNNVSLAILDVMLPDTDGFKLTKIIREKYKFPIIMLTARVEDNDIINGLTMGADDYITKPFNPLELIARIKSQFRRETILLSNKQVNVIDIRGLIIDKNNHEVRLYDSLVSLTPIEFDILYFLATHLNQVVSSENLFEAVWKEKYYNSNNTIMTHIARLREKLNDNSKKPKFIITVWGVGYKIEK